MSSPAVLPAIALVVGALAGISWPSIPDIRIAIVMAGAGTTFAWTRRSRATVIAIAASYLLCGAQLGASATRRALVTPVRAALDAAFGGFRIGAPGVGGAHAPLLSRGTLLEDAAVRDDNTSLRVRLESIAIGGQRATDGVVVLSVNGAAAPARAAEWTAGRTISFPATYRRPARYLNDGVDDFERQSALDGVTLGGTVKSALLVSVAGRGTVLEEAAARVRARVRARVARWMPPDAGVGAAIVTAILIGDRTGLSPELRDRLQAAGTYHVIAISGGNIAILAALLSGVLTLAGLPPRLRAVVTIASLLAYAAIVASGPSVWRATLTATAYLAARIWDHRSPPWNAAGVAAALLVCASPLDVRDVGFVLTFGATCALIAVATRVPLWPSVPVGARWVLITMVASVGVQAVLLPVEATVFSRVSLAGVVLNLLALPLMTIAQVAGLVIVLAPSGAIARLAAWVASMSTSALVGSASLVDQFPWLGRHVPPPFFVVIVAYYGLLLLALRARSHIRGALIIGTAVLAGLIASGHPRRAFTPTGRLSLTVFDVAQGDAMLLTLPDGTRTMVDSGGIGYGMASFDVGTRVLEPALWARGVYDLEALALTHGDPDHIGGAAALVRDLRPAVVHEGVRVAGHLPTRMVVDAARRNGVRMDALRRGSAWSAAGARVRVLHPPAPDWDRRKVRNDDSIVLEVVYGDVAFLLTGDISEAVEREIIPELSPARVRVLKVGHHGSKTSTSQALLDAWRPDVAVISCGRGNPFGHPHPDVLSRLHGVGAKVLRTDLEGQIVIETDGHYVTWRTFTGGRSVRL